jgi:hypothetical protein
MKSPVLSLKVSQRILHLFCVTFSILVCYKVNFLLCGNKRPSSLFSRKITVLLITNYRPITNLNNSSEIFESITHHQLSFYFKRKLDKSQHGVIKSKFTANQLTYLLTYLLKLTVSQSLSVHKRRSIQFTSTSANPLLIFAILFCYRQ